MSEIFEELKKIIDPKEPGFITARERWSNFTLGDGISDFLIGCLNETPSPATIEEPVLDKIKKTLSFCEIDNDYGNHQVWMLYLFLRVYQEISSNKSAKPKSKCLPEFNADIFDDNSDVEGFPDYLKQSPYGLEFVKNLARHISGEKTDSKTSVKFPVAFDPNLGTSVNNLKVVVPKFELFKISDESDGLVLHPYNAFTFFDEMFLSIFPLALRKQKSVPGGGVGTVCVRIKNYVDEYNKYNFPKLKGNSAGGALVTALLSLKYGRIIRNDVALSFAIDGNDELCHWVGLLTDKLRMLKDSVNELIVWKPEDEDERTELEQFGKDNSIKLIFCDTIGAAFGHVTGDTEMILKYLNDFISANQLNAKFFNPSNEHGELKYIDQNMRVKEYKEFSKETLSPGEKRRDFSEFLIKSSEVLKKTENSKVNVVLADSGYGKSFLLKNLALKVATASKDDLEKTGDPKVKIPLLISFNKLIEYYINNTKDCEKKENNSCITEIIKHQLLLEYGEDSKILVAKLDSGEVIFFIDSYDDVLNEAKNTLIKDMNFMHWLNKPKQHVVFASRSNYNIENLKGDFSVIEPLEFDKGSQTEFVTNWFGEINSERIPEVLKVTDITPLTSNPLILFFLCKLWESPTVNRDMQISRVRIYDAIVDEMLNEAWRESNQSLENNFRQISEINEKKSKIAFISFTSFTTEKSKFDIPWICSIAGKKSEENELLDLIEKISIFKVSGTGRNINIGYQHKSLQEFLTASYLGEIVNSKGWKSSIEYAGKEVEIQTLIDKKAWLPEWEQVIIFMSGLLHDVYKKDLLEIIRGTDDIFRHRLSLAARCLPEVLNNFSKN